MANKKEIELTPMHTNQKSFYGKAYYKHAVKMPENGKPSRNFEILYSYDTAVCAIEFQEGEAIAFYRLWDAWSATTSKHIHEFCLQNGMRGFSKKDWENLPTYDYETI